MLRNRATEVKDRLILNAKKLGACAAGIVAVEKLKESPSHQIYSAIGDYQTVGNKEGNITRGEVFWPENAKTVIVVAVEHAAHEPEMDWWIGGYTGGTHGNRKLIDINNRLSAWLENEEGIKTATLPYHIENGGILLKDAAVLAGLGCIGKNNLLVTPQFGPRVRLRALLSFETLPESGPVDFDPCKTCRMPCRKACPQKAFNSRIYFQKDFGIGQLPARSGMFSRPRCNLQMIEDESRPEPVEIEGQPVLGKAIRYCRLCEFACPV